MSNKMIEKLDEYINTMNNLCGDGSYTYVRLMDLREILLANDSQQRIDALENKVQEGFDYIAQYDLPERMNKLQEKIVIGIESLEQYNTDKALCLTAKFNEITGWINDINKRVEELERTIQRMHDDLFLDENGWPKCKHENIVDTIPELGAQCLDCKEFLNKKEPTIYDEIAERKEENSQLRELVDKIERILEYAENKYDNRVSKIQEALSLIAESKTKKGE